jgi:hypothetical protein
MKSHDARKLRLRLLPKQETRVTKQRKLYKAEQPWPRRTFERRNENCSE